MVSLGLNRFVPTAARTGNNEPTLFRAQNWFIRGQGDNTFLEIYGGSKVLYTGIDSVALTGTLAYTTATLNIVGTGTLFRSELHPGQKLETTTGEVIVVSEVITDLLFIAAGLPTSTTASVAAQRLPILFEIDKKSGTLLSGNALEFDRGTILCAGSGTLKVNGSVLPGTSLVASRYAKVAIWREATNDYLVQQLGFDAEPFGITAANSAAAVATTYADTDVNTATNNINDVAHGWLTGQKVTIATPGTLISVSGTAWNTLDPLYIIRIDADNYKVATSLQNAVAGTAADITAAGSGTTTVTPVSKAMPAGDRSIRVAKASTKLGVPSYGNPGEKIKVTITAGGRIAITFPAMDSNASSADPHDAWRIYASPFGGTTGTATANADSGPWYYVRTVETGEVPAAGGVFYLEYLDSEIDATARLITFDNDAPGQAEGIGTVAGYPVLVSCQGKATTAFPDGTAPGPSIIPFKPSNLAAAPLVFDSGQRNEVPLSPPETIIGFYMAAGRLYLMTANTLQIAVFTTDPDFPVSTRPFWKAGFKNPYALCFVNGVLYGFTGNGPTRSSADENTPEGSEEHRFAREVQELTKDWKPENVFVVEDPQNECVCYINTAARVNAAGFWESEILPFMPGTGGWSPKIVFTNNSQDRIISGAATVNGHLEFLLGGKDEVGVFTFAAFRFDTISGETVFARAAGQFSDGGNEKRLKKIKNPRVTGRGQAMTLGIFGAEPGEDISVTTLESGNANSKSGAIALSVSTGVNYRPSEDVIVNGLGCYALCIEETWDGTGEKSRVDEVIAEVVVRSGRK